MIVMRNLLTVVVVGLVFLSLFGGCSNRQSPLIPSGAEQNSFIELDRTLPVGVSDRSPDGSPAAGEGLMGLFNLHIDPVSGSAELTSLREGASTDALEVVDLTNFLELAPCTNCVKIKSVSLTGDGKLDVKIGIKHPFPAGDPFKPITGRNRADLHVFNVEGIVVSNAPAESFAGIEQKVAGFRLANADGYTGYLDNSLDDIFPTDATIHPYILHFDDYSTGNYDPSTPTGFQSVVDPPPTGNLVMAMGCDYNFQDYIFDLPAEPIDFIYSVGCTYALSAANKSQRFTPEYRVPQHNKKAASEVHVEIVSNDLKEDDVASSALLAVKVLDMNHGVEVGVNLDQMVADSSVSAISVEIPGVLTSPVIVSSPSPTGGSGRDPLNPLDFEVTVTNSANASMGTYHGLVKVLDSYPVGSNSSPILNGNDGITRVEPGTPPTSATFQINEFATYQAFNIDVAFGKYLILTAPNGGEEWTGLTHENITWTASASISKIDLYYSKDDFVADSHLIVSDYGNTGTFDWTVANDPSNTVKVKIVESGGTMEDTSDDYFTILWGGCNFGSTGFTLANTYTLSGRWTYEGVKVTQQDPVQRLVLEGIGTPGNHILYIHNADNPTAPPVASYDTGGLIFCNNDRAFWIDPISIPGIDRIIYNNFGSGSPTPGYQLKTIDWDGTQFINPQVLPKHADIQLSSLWNLCVMPNGDLIYHNANTYTPTFLKRDKANGYAISTLFMLQQSTCPFGVVSDIQDIAYDWKLDAIVLLCSNPNASSDGQIFVLSMTGTLLYQDLHVFGGTPIAPHAGVNVDIEDPTCRITVYAGENAHSGAYWIGRYSWDFTEKKVNQYTGLTYGPARGGLCADGTLWTAWENSTGLHKFNKPPDW